MRLVKRLWVLFFFFHPDVFAQRVQTFDISFPSYSPELSENSKNFLNDFLQNLGEQVITSVKIDSYCDEEEGVLFNFTLSERRARAVYDFLEASKKVREETMSYQGHGQFGSTNKNITQLVISYVKKDSLGTKSILNKDSLLAGKSLKLNLNFYPGESRLLPSSLPYLKELEKFLKENPELKIEIDGHVCCNNNMVLSLDRASEVYDRLVGLGIPSIRLKYKGFGNSRPLVEENSDEDREKNRRVEIRLQD